MNPGLSVKPVLTAAGLLFFFALVPGFSAQGSGLTTALEEYVYTPDPAYGYELVSTQPLSGYTVHTLLMNSLEWRSPKEVDRRLWTHQVIIVVPDNVTTNTAIMLINGGSDPLDPVDPLLLAVGATIAAGSGSVLASIAQIPNQPLQFDGRPGPISEDALVAHSWDRAVATGDATWAAYLPMTKASVRGMDAVQNFVSNSVDNVTIEDFVVSGFSKRGATAWLVAAVDPRVRAAAPGVFDILNMAVQIERHWEAYGFYAPAIHDYVDFDIVRRVRSPEGRWLAQIVDPFSYTATLEIPKLVLSSTGDQFFLPDAAQFYFDGLPGETLIRQIPNTDHGLTNGLFLALDALLAWFKTVVSDTPRPVIDWRLNDDVLVVTSDPPAQTATLWQATNADARDFRLESIGAVWADSELTGAKPGEWQVDLAEPAQGWTGYLVELSFPGAGGPPDQTYTTPVFIAPDELPFVLDDPVGRPRVPRYWRCQLPGAPATACPRPPELTAAELESLLQIPLFGEYVSDFARLEALLIGGADAASRARRDCMATRLNVAAKEFDWYSSVRVDRSSDKLWQHYERAEAAFAGGDFVTAGTICRSLNQLGPVLPRR